jgi:catechol 2,3-dioxygenase-like lactoylglutathione lyase family enzyme
MKKTFTYGLTHLAIYVSDLDRTMKFYTDVFDMEVMYHEKNFIQLTTPGCHDIVVFEKSPRKKIVTESGIAHFGFRLREAADVDKVFAKITSAGGEIVERGEFLPGSPYIFFKDPDGYIIEVWFELLPEG